MISIIIPTKNAGFHLKTLLHSLDRQTYKDFEVIINDDRGTNDNTTQVINNFTKLFSIIHTYDNERMAQGRLAGSKRASGQYLLHLDADMKLSPKVLEQCISKIKKGYDAIVVPEISYGVGYWAKVKAFERSFYIGDDTMESARFIKKSAYIKLGGHDPNMVLSEDKDLDLRIRKAGYVIGRIKAHIYHNEGKLSLRKDMNKKFYYGKTAKVFLDQNPKHAAKQANLVFRPAFFRNWKRLLSNPELSIAVFIMKSLEALAAFAGVISTKIPLIDPDPWKN